MFLLLVYYCILIKSAKRNHITSIPAGVALPSVKNIKNILSTMWKSSFPQYALLRNSSPATPMKEIVLLRPSIASERFTQSTILISSVRIVCTYVLTLFLNCQIDLNYLKSNHQQIKFENSYLLPFLTPLLCYNNSKQ